MHRSLIMLVGVAGIASASVVAPSPAKADCIGCAVGAGILAGAVIGSIIANSPPPGYYPPPPAAYYGPPNRYYASGGGRCRELRQACLHKEELGEAGMGNCRTYREFCR